MQTITIQTKVVSMLQKGDRVMIHEDPITKLKPEGSAILQRRLGPDYPGNQQRWSVKFEGEDECAARFIAPPWEVIVSNLELLAEDLTRSGRENKGKKVWQCVGCGDQLPVGTKHFYWHATATASQARLCATCQEKVEDQRRLITHDPR